MRMVSVACRYGCRHACIHACVGVSTYRDFVVVLVVINGVNGVNGVQARASTLTILNRSIRRDS
jgi:hypothetical protein